MRASALTVHELRKSYGPLTAVDGISFDVERGEIFGVVGPNGAGKTTTLECVEGLRSPDSGRVRCRVSSCRRASRRSLPGCRSPRW